MGEFILMAQFGPIGLSLRDPRLKAIEAAAFGLTATRRRLSSRGIDGRKKAVKWAQRMAGAVLPKHLHGA